MSIDTLRNNVFATTTNELYSLFQEKRKLKHRVLNWKPMEKNDLMSLVKWKRLT